MVGVLLDAMAGERETMPAREVPRPSALPTIEGYALGPVLGRGAFGSVYRARQLALQREVAIKLLPIASVSDGAAIAQMSREAITLAALNHENVLSIYDSGTTGEFFFLVTELAAGSLRAYLARHDRSHVMRSIRFARQIMHGLAAAHAAGVLHRDIKPENILVRDLADDEPVLKLADFGLARHAADTSGPGVAGTPGYIAPELWAGAPVTPQSDLFAAGVVLFEIFAGKHPFESDHALELRVKIAREEAPSLRDLDRDIPSALARLVDSLLAKDPAARPSGARRVVAALDDMLAELAEHETTRARLAASHIKQARLAVAEHDYAAAALLYAEANHVKPSFLARANALYYSRRLPALRTILDHQDARTVRFDPAATVFAVASGDTVTVYDAITCRLIRTLKADEDVKSVALSADGLVVAGGVTGMLAAWNASTPSGFSDKLADTANGLVITPDGWLVCAGNDGRITRWDLAGQRRTDQTEPLGLLHGIAYLTRSKRFAFTNVGGKVLLTSLDQPEVVELEHGTKFIWDVAVSVDERRLASASLDGTIRLWDARSGQPHDVEPSHRGDVNALTFSRDGRWLVSGGADAVCRCWTATAGQPTGIILRHTAAIWAVATDERSLVVTGGDDVRVWDLQQVVADHQELVHDDMVEGLELACGQLVTWDASNEVRAWDLQTRPPRWRTLPGPRVEPAEPPNSEQRLSLLDGTRLLVIPPRPEGQLRSAADAPRLSLRNVQSGAVLMEVPFRDKDYGLFEAPKVCTIASAPVVAIAVSANTIRLFELESGRPIGKPIAHRASIFGCSVDLAGTRLVTFSMDGIAKISNARTGDAIGREMVHPRGAMVGTARFCIDDRAILTTSSANIAALWDGWTGEPIGEPLEQGGDDYNVRIAAELDENARVLVTRSHHSVVRLWDVAHLFVDINHVELLHRIERQLGFRLGDTGDFEIMTRTSFMKGA